MDQIADNMQKYYNYREQMDRLKKAINNGFFLEAIFIEYAVMEDRLESVLRHSGIWNPKPDTFMSIDQKLRKISKMAEEKKSLAHKYFTQEMLENVKDWKESRNKLIHALLKQTLHIEDLEKVAVAGQALVKLLCSKTSSYNRALERKLEKEQELMR